MKSQEQRISDAAVVLRSRVHFNPGRPGEAVDVARAVLEAADREPPKWPTDESVETIWHGGWVSGHEEQRLRTREAFMADPIIKAAIALRDEIVLAVGPVGPETARVVQAVIDAVNEAGL